jgi:hypothetical protein
MSVLTKSADATIAPADGAGEFDMILSNGTRDRDGDRLDLKSWAQPLPDSVPINLNHSKDVSDIVGSGRPFFDSEGNLRVKGTFASTGPAQHIRQLVNEGHLRSVSVEFVKKAGKNVLVGGAFVRIPSNPEARVLESKGLDDFATRLEAILAGDDSVITKSSDGASMAMVQAIHDASYHLGAQCVGDQCAMEPDVDPDSGASDGANKALALQLRLKAISS